MAQESAQVFFSDSGVQEVGDLRLEVGSEDGTVFLPPGLQPHFPRADVVFDSIPSKSEVE